LYIKRTGNNIYSERWYGNKVASAGGEALEGGIVVIGVSGIKTED